MREKIKKIVEKRLMNERERNSLKIRRAIHNRINKDMRAGLREKRGYCIEKEKFRAGEEKAKRFQAS